MAQLVLDTVLNLDIGQQALYNAYRTWLPLAVSNTLGIKLSNDTSALHASASEEGVYYSDLIFYTAALALSHSVPFFGLNIFYHLFQLCRPQKFESLRFQKGKYCNPALVLKSVIYTLVFHLIAPLGPFLLFKRHLASTPTLMDGPVPGVGMIFLQLVACYAFTDFFFYWGHRTLHLPIFYAPIHKQHHEFKVTVGWAAQYAHPVELVIGNIWPVLSAPILLKMHFSIWIIWIFIALLGSIATHSGMWYPSSFTGFHDFHHSHNVGNYGSLPFWDWLCGTDKAYRKWKASFNAPVYGWLDVDKTNQGNKGSAAEGGNQQPVKKKK